MPATYAAGVLKGAVKIKLFAKDTGYKIILEALSVALAQYLAPVKNRQKRQKAVASVAQSISTDNNWLHCKNMGDPVVSDGALVAYFNDGPSVALLLDAVFNPRPAYQKESREQGYFLWVEACNPVEDPDGFAEALRTSYNVMFKHFATIRAPFNLTETQLIYNEVEKRASSLYATENRLRPIKGSFLEYVKKMAFVPVPQNTFEIPSTQGVHATQGISDTQGADIAPEAQFEQQAEYAPEAQQTQLTPEIQYAQAAPYVSRIFGSGWHELPFAGRETELFELKKFCYSDRRLLWWSVAGRGGVGKSRLARELCRLVTEERGAWYCVFLPMRFFDSADRFGGEWPLDKNLLAVIDSPGYYAGKVGHFIRRLVESDSVNRKIRLLILEREGIVGGGGEMFNPVAPNPVAPNPVAPNQNKPIADMSTAKKPTADAPIADADADSAFSAEVATYPIMALAIPRRNIFEPTWFKKMYSAVDRELLTNICYNPDMSSMQLAALDSSHYPEMVEKYARANNVAEDSKLKILRLWHKLGASFPYPWLLAAIVSAINDESIINNNEYFTENDGSFAEIEGCSNIAGFFDTLYRREIDCIISIVGHYVQSSGAPAVPGQINRLVTATAITLAYAAMTSNPSPAVKAAGEICALAGLGESGQQAQRFVRQAIKYYGLNGALMAGSPDLFTEYFVINTFKQFGAGGVFDAFAVNKAWADNGHSAANFIYRVIDDYFYEYGMNNILPGADALLHAAPSGSGREAAVMYSELLVYLSAALDASGRHEVAARLYKFRERGFTREKGVTLKMSQLLFNLTADQDAAGIAGIAALMEKMRGHGFSRDREITLRLIKTLYNLLVYQAADNRKETVKRMETIRKNGFEQDREIALILAQSMFMLTSKQDENGIKNTVARLEALRGQGFEADRDITLELVKSLLNLTTKQDEAGRKETAARIEALRGGGFEQDRDITLELTKALLNLTIKQDEAGVVETAHKIEELRGSGFENDKDMALVLAQALLNLTTKQDAAGIANTVARLERLRSQGFEGDRDITLELAASLFNLTTRQDDAGIRVSVRKLEELRNSGFTHDRDITLRLAQALFSLTTKQGVPGREEAANRIDELRSRKFEQDRDITLTLVKSLYNLTIEQDSENTKKSVARIEEICGQGYGQDTEIRLLFAKSLFNLTTKLDEGGIADTVTRLESLRGTNA